MLMDAKVCKKREKDKIRLPFSILSSSYYKVSDKFFLQNYSPNLKTYVYPIESLLCFTLPPSFFKARACFVMFS